MSIETPLIDHSSFDGAVLIVGLLVRLSTQKIDNLKPVLAGSEHARSCHQLIAAVAAIRPFDLIHLDFTTFRGNIAVTVSLHPFIWRKKGCITSFYHPSLRSVAATTTGISSASSDLTLKGISPIQIAQTHRPSDF